MPAFDLDPDPDLLRALLLCRELPLREAFPVVAAALRRRVRFLQAAGVMRPGRWVSVACDSADGFTDTFIAQLESDNSITVDASTTRYADPYDDAVEE